MPTYTFAGTCFSQRAFLKASACASVICRKGEPPPIEAYPSLLFGARTTDINWANGFWRKRNSLGSRMMSGSAKRLNKKGCTSSRVSGPPRFSNTTPILSSLIRGAAVTF
uniref:Ferrochelatase-2ic-like n=2 Tax=Rhizophora mucronata TaxID=61149 RepID=A0A2P2KXU0_RHIMU